MNLECAYCKGRIKPKRYSTSTHYNKKYCSWTCKISMPQHPGKNKGIGLPSWKRDKVKRYFRPMNGKTINKINIVLDILMRKAIQRADEEKVAEFYLQAYAPK